MKNQLVAEKQVQLEELVREQQSDLAAMKQMLREQQVELAALRETLAQKQAKRTVPATATTPPVSVSVSDRPLTAPDTSRRKMLKRLGLAVLAGGAALGITSATYAPAEAKLSVNPTTKIGAIITRNGATITNIPPIPNYGLLVSADDSFDASSALTNISGFNVGVFGNSSGSNGTGVQGYSSGDSGTGVSGSNTGSGGVGVYGNSSSGDGVYGNSDSGWGVFGRSDNSTGVYGITYSASDTTPAIVAESFYHVSGIALQILKGGLTVAGAGIGTQTAAFIHQTTADNISGTASKIDNPLCNGRQNALLFVTHNYNPPNANASLTETNAFGVDYYMGYWYIYHENTSTAMVANTYYNVLIINP